jgi:hypothetical protein
MEKNQLSIIICLIGVIVCGSVNIGNIRDIKQLKKDLAVLQQSRQP